MNPHPTPKGPPAMLEQQRQDLVKAVAALLDEGAATYWELEHRRILYGATRDELTELLHDLDTQVAHQYTADALEHSTTS